MLFRSDNKQDQVITNAAATEPLVRELGLDDLTETVAETPVRRVGRFTSGGHGSLLALDGSDEGAVLSEIQTQFGSFFATAGTTVPVGNAALLCTGSAAECVKE